MDLIIRVQKDGFDNTCLEDMDLIKLAWRGGFHKTCIHRARRDGFDNECAERWI